MKTFENVKKNLGFGCMRLPMKENEVDYKEFSAMIDEFMRAGFNYFDTAHIYIGGKSEPALRECLVKRYPRNSFVFADKLSDSCFEREEDIIPLFNRQLEICGLDYFDFYLMHSQNEELYEKYKKCRAYETAFELKKQGKIKYVGLSFHDDASLLDRILTDYPETEFVQIQLNYADYNDPSVQGKECYEVCEKHRKPVIVMEPVKGGTLVNLPKKAAEILENLRGGSLASYAIRYAASFKNVFMVLSGMSNVGQMKDNISFMRDFKPLEDNERAAIEKVCKVFSELNLIQCTACRYCVDGCPKRIIIPNLFALLNAKVLHDSWNASYYYNEIYVKNNGKASDCIKCGKCEKICPQHLKIRELLEKVAREFEN